MQVKIRVSGKSPMKQVTIATEVEKRWKPNYTQTMMIIRTIPLPAGETHPSFRNIKMSREDMHPGIKKTWWMERERQKEYKEGLQRAAEIASRSQENEKKNQQQNR